MHVCEGIHVERGLYVGRRKTDCEGEFHVEKGNSCWEGETCRMKYMEIV